MAHLEIRPLTGEDLAAWRKVRLRMLTEDPYAFGSTPEEFATRSDEDIRAQLVRSDPDEGFLLGAFIDGMLVGSTGVYRERGTRARHKASIYAVYVAPETRGHGIAQRLVRAAIARARTIAGIEQLRLWVASENERARSVYESSGFRLIATEPEALKFPDRYVDEHMMMLFLRDVS